MKKSPEFFYHRKDGRDTTYTIGMDLIDMAFEPAYIARNIYQAIMKENPAIAETYKNLVIKAVTDPDIWDLSDAVEPEISAVITETGETELPN